MKIGKYDGKTLERYLELKNKRTLLAEEGLPILERLRDSRGISSEQAAHGKEVIREFEKIDNEIEELERQAGGPPEGAEPIKLDPQDIMTNRFRSYTYNSGLTDRSYGRTYRNLFYGDPGASLSDGGFDNFREFVDILSSGRYDPRLRGSTRAMTEGVPSEGGFLVPEEFSAMLLDAALESEVVRPRATVYKMERQTRKIPGFDGYDHSSNLFGGFSGSWLSEGGTATRQNAKLRQIALTAKKLGIYTQASRELVEDGMAYDEQITGAMTQAIGWFLDYAFLQGTGAGMPLGVLSDPALVTASKETGQPASTVLYENITKMLARLHPAAFRGAIWAANQTLLPQLMQMSLSVGTGGTAIKAVEERNGRYYLLGKELVFTEKLPTLGSEGDILLADFSKYAIGMRQEVVLDKSNAPG